jgi:hypothetical protein
MARESIRLGAVQHVLPVDRIADLLLRRTPMARRNK